MEAFGEDGVKFDEQNAGGEYNNCATIVDGFVSENVDLMLANATYSLQAAQSATADIPILGTAITNYGIALGLDSTEDKVLGGNISGTSDLAPLDQQAAMLQELFPDAEKRGPALLLRRAQLRVSGGDHPGLSGGDGLHLYPVRLHRRERPLRRDPVRL